MNNLKTFNPYGDMPKNGFPREITLSKFGIGLAFCKESQDRHLRSMRKFSDDFSITTVNFSDYHEEGENDA